MGRNIKDVRLWGKVKYDFEYCIVCGATVHTRTDNIANWDANGNPFITNKHSDVCGDIILSNIDFRCRRLKR